MNTFTNAVIAQETETTNGMKAYQSTLNANVDLFFKIGACRGQNVLGYFTAAYLEDPEIALRIAQWVRDVRGGAGERQIFRDILTHLEKTNPTDAKRLIGNIPEIGRWDDLLVLTNPLLKQYAFSLVKTALENGNQLCAKWMPRKGKIAEELRAYLEFSPKRYRKTLVTLSNTVETKMCAQEWDTIEFGHVPSLAAARYRKAFKRNAEVAYTEYAEALSKGEAKINAGAVYPYDVLKTISSHTGLQTLGTTGRQVIVAQWDALPNFIGDANILPMVDVSGSMGCAAGPMSSKLTCMEVAVSLGLYIADKNEGKFKDTFLTFTSSPELLHLKGDVVDKMVQMSSAEWGMTTNIEAAFKKVLSVAKTGNVPQAEMPEYILILSDMQFDRCSNVNQSAMEMIKDQYEAAGYQMPKIVFWNLHESGNVPARFTDDGVALISGFSPAIMKSVLRAENFDPRSIMLDALMIERYDLV